MCSVHRQVGPRRGHLRLRPQYRVLSRSDRSVITWPSPRDPPRVNNNNNNILTVKSCREILGDGLGDTSFVHGLMKFSLFSHASFLWNLFGL